MAAPDWSTIRSNVDSDIRNKNYTTGPDVSDILQNLVDRSGLIRQTSSESNLNSISTDDASVVIVHNNVRDNGVFLAQAADPYGNGDDGAMVLASSNGEWWVRTEARNPINASNFGSGESAVRDALSFSKPGDTVLMPDSMTPVNVGNGTITIGKNRRIVSQSDQGGNSDPTFVKQFNGTLLKYNDWVQIIDVKIDGNKGNGYNGHNVESLNSVKKGYFKNVTSLNAESTAWVRNESFYSTFVNCWFVKSQDGLAFAGNNNAPHTNYIRCRFGVNDRAGIDVRERMEDQHLFGCLIDNNKYGIDTERAGVGRSIFQNSFQGCLFQENDGPAIVARGGTTAKIRVDIPEGTIFRLNNQNIPAAISTTQPPGDIHAENGSIINGNIGGQVSRIMRVGNNGAGNPHLTLTGRVGEVYVPGTDVSAISAQKTNIQQAANEVQLDPSTGGFA